MPIAFPLPLRDPPHRNIQVLYRKPFFVVPAPNMGRVGTIFSQGRLFSRDVNSLDPGIGVAFQTRAPNVRNLGGSYVDVTSTARLNPENIPFTDERVPDREFGFSSFRLTGVSRDVNGAALGSCVVKVFRTSDDVLVASTTSDSSGNWSLDMMASGPFYLVEYKAGSPDVFGTSLNTLTPAAA